MAHNCDPYSALAKANDYSCYGTTGPYGDANGKGYNLTSAEYPAANQTGQASMDALLACCKMPVTASDPEVDGTCHSQCKTTGLEMALEVSYCLGNYTQKHSDYFYGSLGCETTVSGATMLGRTSSWGGLAILGLVVSTAATMM